ncbi:CAP domain-containing protein [Streptomyces sp. MZ04]|uniref:CAP domain-containing protein n=1 Tax=Streptomyces sp. MZ04 TaxID=2559236 RepID=UPI00107E70D9|nr:CAP domain-containing protein [Streptomyces sp. MZ04]TGB06065.1 CAP domain-containing protein [Streptomyces sp. MZ04]
MGRHRRSGAGGAATGRATGAPASYADDYAGAPEPRTAAVSHRRKGRVAAPVRTGLLGVSAAVAMGAVAIASGLVPGSDNYSLGGGDSNKVRSASSPTGVAAQGGADAEADAGRESTPPSRDTDRSEAPDPSPSQSTAKPSRTPSEKPSSQAPKPKPEPEEKTQAPSPSRTAPQKPKAPPAASPKPPPAESAAEATVLTLVNVERAKAGCSPVRADDSLASLAGDFSSDMATRDFFDHTDPDGATPWDRAEKAGIADLGGENIARGQANAQSVMDAWMNSAGHRDNILNCDYKTLGVGAHFAPGGPWWTQDFGF